MLGLLHTYLIFVWSRDMLQSSLSREERADRIPCLVDATRCRVPAVQLRNWVIQVATGAAVCIYEAEVWGNHSNG